MFISTYLHVTNELASVSVLVFYNSITPERSPFKFLLDCSLDRLNNVSIVLILVLKRFEA